ncbi:uncharacterized protein LOC128551549 [Mercenaria mercenaria]|uniref:uncharacterized protein LOC128551549 n=1 Tax=Mercenaria mercenaria TaxID=6596 RepID=UPI00234E6B15|nr:uncharacterized protein LOC128551549 [Mercenaria mercenaria]
MDRLLQRKRKENSTLINAFLTKRLQSMYDNVIGRPISNKYVKPGGFRKYKLEMDRLKRQYKAEMKGVNEYEVQKALIYFIGSKMVRENELMMSEELPEENETCEPLTLIQREANELQQTCQSVATDVLYKSELSLQKLRATTKENITKTDASYQTILNELTRTMEILEELALGIKMQQQSEEKMFLKHLEDLRMEKPLNEEDENKSLELLLEQLSYVSFSEDLDF